MKILICVPFLGLWKDFSGIPGSKGTHQGSPDCFAMWLAKVHWAPAVNESFFLSSSSLTFGMVYFSYFFSCPSV